MTTIEDITNHFKNNETLKRSKTHNSSTFQLLTGKTYEARKYNKIKNENRDKGLSKMTSLRIIKSAPFQINNIKNDDITEEILPSKEADEKPYRSLYDNIENASLFSIDSKASLKTYNYTDVYKKFPSLTKHAESIRRNLFKNYMKTFDDTNENFKFNENLFDKTEQKNIASEIRNLIYTFERDSTNRALINRKTKECPVISAKSVKKETSKPPNVESELTEKTVQANLSEPKIVSSQNSFSNGKLVSHQLSKTSSNENNSHKTLQKEEKVFNQVAKNMKKLNLKSTKNEFKNINAASTTGFEDIFITSSSGDVIIEEETYDDDDLPIDNKKLKTHLRVHSPISQEDSSLKLAQAATLSITSNEFIDNEDERYYNRNKQKFMKNTEQAHRSIFNFAKQALIKQEKCLPKPVEPKLRTIEELNLKDDTLIKQIRLNRLTKLLENNDDFNNNEQQQQQQQPSKSKFTNSSTSLSYKHDDDDEYIDDEDEDEEFNKQYRINLRKRQHYLKLLKYMYVKAYKNQAKTENSINRPENDENLKIQNKNDDNISKSLSTIPQSPLLSNTLTNEAFVNSEAPTKPAFRISIPFRHDNISNYEVFIPHRNQNNQSNNNLNDLNSASTSTRSSISNSNKFYDTNNGSEVKDFIPLNITSLNNVKVMESKAKSNFWHNYK